MNTKNPKISVIIPVYNTSAYLRQCLDSVLCQDFDDYEVICVNDGSTDNSLEILREYKDKSDKIKIVNQINSGVAVTRNTGLEEARGDFLAFLDSDDFIRENYLSKLYNKAIKTNSDIVICNFYRYYENSNVAKPVSYKFRSGEFDKYKILKGSIPDNSIHAYLWNKLWKREIFEQNEFPNMKYEDLAIVSKLMYRANKITVINDALYYYRIRKTSIVRSISLNTQNDYMKAYALIRLFLKQSNEFDTFKREFYFFSLKASIVMSVVNILLLKENLSFKLFMQNMSSTSAFIKYCKSDEFCMSEREILNYNVISDMLEVSLLNTKAPK